MFGQYVTASFVTIIIVMFMVSVALAKKGKGDRFVTNTPNLLASIGVLGTFAGIVIGLIGFDISHIDDSIDELLEGLKTAFITSLVGMGGSIAFKILNATPLLLPRERVATGKDVGPALLDAMRSQGNQLEALRQAIAGDEESSLAGQIKLFRSDTRDRYDAEKNYMEHSLGAFTELTEQVGNQRETFEAFTVELWQRLSDFAEMLSKSATEQVINALKEVIADFNKNLTEQFGENFKALDAAVQRLVQWQENYRVQLEQMGEQYRQGVIAITQTEASVAHISEESRQIPPAMESLRAVLKVNQHQIDELGQHLQAFKEVRDKAVEAVPELQRQVDATVTSITNATQQLAAGMSESTDQARIAIVAGAEALNANVTAINNNAREMVQVLVDGSRSMTEESAGMKNNLQETGRQVQADAQAIQERVADSIGQMQRRLESALQEVFQAQTREMDRVFAGIDQAVTRVAERTGENVNTQLGFIDSTMTQEVERVMTEMGRALAAITGRFTTDYERLVKAMQAVVRQGDDRA